jgi:hypothetical protein
MKCPHCNREFKLTYARYWLLTRRKFACPHCSKRSAFDPNPFTSAIVVGGTTIFSFLGIGIAHHWLRGPHCLVGVLPVLLAGVPTVKLAEQKWARLKPAGDPNTASTAVCAECKSEAPVQDMIMHNSVYYCAACKPIFLQKLAEGCAPRPRTLPSHLLRRWWFWVYIAVISVATFIFTRHYILQP